MKKVLFIAAVALTTLVACNQQNPEPVAKEQCYEITITIMGQSTTTYEWCTEQQAQTLIDQQVNAYKSEQPDIDILGSKKVVNVATEESCVALKPEE